MDAPRRRRKGKIHAMPPAVRARIDGLLRADRHTFAEIKAIMAAEFPEEEPLSTSGIHRYDARIRVYTEKMRELETHARVLAEKYGKNEETGNLLSQAVMTLATDTALNLMASGEANLDDVRKLAQTAHTAIQGKQVSLKVRQQIEAEVREKVLAEQKTRLEALKEAALVSEQTARVTGDTANAQSISTEAARIDGLLVRLPAALANWQRKPASRQGLLVDGLTVIESLGFWPWTDAVPAATAAEAAILDAAGRLDHLVMNEAIGSQVTLRHLDRASNVISPAGRWRLDAVSISDDNRRTLRLTDPHDALDTPVSRGVFLPNLPALAFKPIPVVIGAVASVPALSANNDGTVRFVADNAIHVADVMDRGDLMEPGTFSTSPDQQQLLMESPPVGPVVCDASSIGLLNGEPRPATLQQALSDLFARIGFAAWSSSDAAAIDAASGYAGIGYYASEPATARAALHAILASYGAWYWRDGAGILRFVRITAPETATPAFEITAADMSADLVRETDKAPNLTRRVAYRPNAQALGASDLVTDIETLPQARRDQLTALWRGQVYAAGSLPACYAHADSAEPFISTLWRRDDAQAEAERVIALYGNERASFQVTLKGTLNAVPMPGETGLLRYPKYGLASGLPVVVRRIERSAPSNDTRLVLWG